MLQALLKLLQTDPLDVRIWDCDPLLVVMNGTDIAYGQNTNVEFTPFDAKATTGHAIATNPDPDGLRPEIAIVGMEVIAAWQSGQGPYQRGGLILSGTDQFDGEVRWLINRPADEFMLNAPYEQVPYDEETEAALAEELKDTPPTDGTRRP